MKKLLILLLFPLMIFAQDSTLIGDVDCSGEVNSQDASLILQFVTNLIDEPAYKRNGIDLEENPHSSESERIIQFKLNIKNNKLPPGIAIDDGVAVLFIDGKPSQVYSSRKNHDAYFVDKNKKISLKEYIKKKNYE